MKTLALQIEAGVDTRVKDTASNVLRQVAIKTPFKTGRAKFNWQVSKDAPLNSSLFSPSYGGAHGAATAIMRAIPLISTYDGDINKSLHITNNLMYISKLNAGSSKQAAANYVQTAIKIGVSLSSKKKIL